MAPLTPPAALETLRERPLPQAYLRAGVHAFSALRERSTQIPPQSRRQLDFDAGRLCARRALERAGAPMDAAIPRGADRAPVWPQGFVGSITHTDRLVAAAVAPSGAYSGLGIDVESWMSDPAAEDVIPQIDFGHELTLLTRALPVSRARAATILFSAKEALYKALAPRAGRFFGFDEAALITVIPGADSSAATGSAELTLELQNDLCPTLPRGLRVGAQVAWDDQGVESLVVTPPEALTEGPVSPS
ncbi:MAG: 4'-phosphopantetheinyl transferase superfamily protein [Bdellovibrionales bacterium]|nr:4'-phosphopantetheinyl transferase superfamily protein [Bdellovibrionales bacterium]